MKNEKWYSKKKSDTIRDEKYKSAISGVSILAVLDISWKIIQGDFDYLHDDIVFYAIALLLMVFFWKCCASFGQKMNLTIIGIFAIFLRLFIENFFDLSFLWSTIIVAPLLFYIGNETVKLANRNRNSNDK